MVLQIFNWTAFFKEKFKPKYITTNYLNLNQTRLGYILFELIDYDIHLFKIYEHVLISVIQIISLTSKLE